MSLPKPLVIAASLATFAIGISVVVRSTDHISISSRAHSSFSAPGGDRTPTSSLMLRLVDSGGVGVPSGDWGRDYSHDNRTFRDAILEKAPYVDEGAFQRIEQDWHRYIDRMVEYGNNAVTVPLFLELIDFDRVRFLGSAQTAIYEPKSSFVARQAAVRRHFIPLFEWASKRGVQVFLTTDMLTLTTPLAQYLRNVAAGGGAVGINTSDPAVWAVYRAGLEELFDKAPSISGVVLRFGEGGALYNTAGWPYRSEMALRSATSLRAMLRGLLPAFEMADRRLVLRSWTVGVGEIGKLHVDPHVYDSVLGEIDSPALIVSTKFTAGDFFSYLPLNPTLASGRHLRLIELQAKPEFEGSSAFPDFLGGEHARALRELRAANARIVGTYVLTQFGGPLRAGPRSLYPLRGFWLWTDANTFVASQLAIHPDADVSQLARQWATAHFGGNTVIVDAVTNILLRSRDVVLKGFYIRPFAEREIRIAGLELPPLMWIFEWDMVGGWHSLLSLVYRGSRDDVDLAIREGDEAAAVVRRGREELQAIVAAAAPGSCPPLCMEMVRSLKYQETLFDALAAWRQAFLSYYRWLDTGDTRAWNQWQAGKTRFESAAAQHSAQFGTDLDFPAFDFTSATRAVKAAERTGLARWIAAGLATSSLLILFVGSPLGQRLDLIARPTGATRVGRLAWTAALTPWCLGRHHIDGRASAAVTLMAVVLVGALIATLTGFTSVWMDASVSALLAIAAFTFERAAGDGAGPAHRGRLLVAIAASVIPGVVALLVLVASLSPLGFWYYFWMVPAFRSALLLLILGMLLWMPYATYAAARGSGWHHAAAGRSLAAIGVAIVALTLLLPDWLDLLRFLDRPLNFAPATETMRFALRTYVGAVNVAAPLQAIGVLLTVLGGLLWRRSVVRARQPPPAQPA
jgi:hypothetical protein